MLPKNPEQGDYRRRGKKMYVCLVQGRWTDLDELPDSLTKFSYEFGEAMDIFKSDIEDLFRPLFNRLDIFLIKLNSFLKRFL